MNNFVEELCGISKLPFNEITKDYKIIMLSNKSLYLCNFIRVLDYSDTKIVVKLKKVKSLEITGENLQICQINKSELIIKGYINLIDFGENNEKK